MKRLILLLIIVLTAGAVAAAEDNLKRGMKLYKQHRYDDAFQVLHANGSEPAADRHQKLQLSLGMVSLQSARLYQQLYGLSLRMSLDYLTRLIADEQQIDSKLVKFYLGKTLLQTGELTESTAFLTKFFSDESVPKLDRHIAGIELGAAYYLQGNRVRAEQFWAKTNAGNPATAASLASVYSRLGMDDKQPAALCGQALSQQPSGSKPSIRMVADIVGVYAGHDRVDEGLQLLQQTDLRSYFHEEVLVENKVIRFYDPMLLQSLFRLYASAAVDYLQKAAGGQNAKLSAAAGTYLCRAYEMSGKMDLSLQLAEKLLSEPNLAVWMKNRLRVCRAIAQFQLGQKEAAKEQFAQLLKSKSDPDMVAELLMACGRHGIDFPQAVINASELAQKGEGRAISRLNHSLGSYYLWKKDYVKAVSYMEAGRDKSNKNRIEFNDPLMLVHLADAYYYSRKYSEALEIFFEMSKQFPAVRQIQVAIQGVYSMEQKSAGDAKIF